MLLALEEAGGLLAKEAYQHKYPYDWRTKKPTIFRATDQWFASVDRFRTAALGAIDEVILGFAWRDYLSGGNLDHPPSFCIAHSGCVSCVFFAAYLRGSLCTTSLRYRLFNIC